MSLQARRSSDETSAGTVTQVRTIRMPEGGASDEEIIQYPLEHSERGTPNEEPEWYGPEGGLGKRIGAATSSRKPVVVARQERDPQSQSGPQHPGQATVSKKKARRPVRNNQSPLTSDWKELPDPSAQLYRGSRANSSAGSSGTPGQMSRTALPRGLAGPPRLPQGHRAITRSMTTGSAPLLPAPSEAYRKIAQEKYRLRKGGPPSPPPLLILDLNGTLLHKGRGRTAMGTLRLRERPFLDAFLDYAFSSVQVDDTRRRRWTVMVWSSAKPHNVLSMVHRCGMKFEPGADLAWRDQPLGIREQIDDLAGKITNLEIDGRYFKPLRAVWTRTDMDLAQADYDQKVQTYKNLEKVWAKVLPEPGAAPWGPRNTAIVDDSAEKCAYQPYNRIPISEFTGQKDAALLSLIDVLHQVWEHDNIAAFSYQKRVAELGLGTGKSIARGRKLCEELNIPMMR